MFLLMVLLKILLCVNGEYKDKRFNARMQESILLNLGFQYIIEYIFDSDVSCLCDWII